MDYLAQKEVQTPSNEYLQSLEVEVKDLRESNSQLQKETEHFKAHNESLKEQVALLKRHLYGKSSERFTKTSSKEEQSDLFNETYDESEDGDTPPPVEETTDVKPHKRKRGGRKPLPEDLTREQIIHDLTPEEKICSCCHCEMQKIGNKVKERLKVIPQQFIVEEHIRYRYACKACEESGVHTAPLSNEVIPKSMATPSLLSAVLIYKYSEHLPLYRQADYFKRQGIDLSRALLSNWVLRCGELLLPIVESMKQEIKEKSPYIQMDETPVQVIKSQKSKAAKKYMWVQVGKILEHPKTPWYNLIYTYGPGRNREVALQLLKGYKGFLQTDLYKAYEGIDKKNKKITRVGCMAHVRRKFYDASVASTKKKGKSLEALEFIKKLYAIEGQIKDQKPEEKKEIRQEQSKPILEEFKKWLDKYVDRVAPKILLGKAIRYALKAWPYVMKYIEDGRLEIDNNRCERAIRPFAQGRRNWLFKNSDGGAEASAVVYSLIQTCRENNINAYNYLLYVFAMIECGQQYNLAKLTPFAVKDKIPTKMLSE